MEVSDASDEQLWAVCKKLPSDWEPHGERIWKGRREDRPDCATCIWFLELYRTWPDWGVCANPESPRAGLLTFWEQGCWQFEPQKGDHYREALRTRCTFKNAFEHLLCEQMADYVREKIREVNDPLAEGEAGSAIPEDIGESPLYVMLCRLLRHAKDAFRREDVNEIAEKARHDTRRYWEYARRQWARDVAEDVSDIRLPSNIRELEDEFWKRVEIIVREALAGRGVEPNEKGTQGG